MPSNDQYHVRAVQCDHRASADEIYARARHAIEYCRGRASLVMFTGNTINPDIPPDNIRAMYRAVQVP